MRDTLEFALKSQTADYIEIRLEEVTAERISYRGKELESIGRNFSVGGNVRAAVKGGWGFASFNDITRLKESVALAVEQARLTGSGKTILAPVFPVVDIVPPLIKKDPGKFSMAQKKNLLDEYNDLVWRTPYIQSSNISYGDIIRKITFANSEGSYIEQTKVDVIGRFAAFARKDGDVQQATLSLGSNGDFGVVEGIHTRVEEMAKRAVDLLSAKPPKSGEYTVICDPILAGVFVHEAFGHLSESDFIYENAHLRDLMVLGRQFGGKHLNVVDGAGYPGLRGSYKYDEEGVPGGKTDLIREGVLVGRLHSRETAGIMGEAPTGNARAVAYRHKPIVRMTNTFIEPGDSTLEDMLSGVQEGIYARNWYGGTTSMEMFTFSAGEAYMIRNGRIEELVRGAVLSGNVFSTLANIDAIGRDLDMNEGGGCGKGEQSPLPVSNGSPHIRIQKCVIGGS